MKECAGARDYLATRPPACNGGDPCDACRTKWAAASAAASLEQFATHRGGKSPGCAVCLLFAVRPDLRAQADAGRQPAAHRLQLLSYETIAGYLRLQGGDVATRLTKHNVRDHYAEAHR